MLFQGDEALCVMERLSFIAIVQGHAWLHINPTIVIICGLSPVLQSLFTFGTATNGAV